MDYPYVQVVYVHMMGHHARGSRCNGVIGAEPASLARSNQSSEARLVPNRTPTLIACAFIASFSLTQRGHTQAHLADAGIIPGLGPTMTNFHYSRLEQPIEFYLFGPCPSAETRGLEIGVPACSTATDSQIEPVVSGRGIASISLNDAQADALASLNSVFPDRRFVAGVDIGLTSPWVEPLPLELSIGLPGSIPSHRSWLGGGRPILDVDQASRYCVAFAVPDRGMPWGGGPCSAADFARGESFGEGDLVAFGFESPDDSQGFRPDRIWPLHVAAARPVTAGGLVSREIVKASFRPSSILSSPTAALRPHLERLFAQRAWLEPRSDVFVALTRGDNLISGLSPRLSARTHINELKIAISVTRKEDRQSKGVQTTLLPNSRNLGRNTHVINGLSGEQSVPGGVLAAGVIGLGSQDAVHDDRQATVVIDNGWILATNLAVPIGRFALPGVAEKADGGQILLTPFIDTGFVRNSQSTEGVANDPWSIGAGIDWQITGQTDLRFGVGMPLVGSDSPEYGDRQDLGFQFRLATALGD
jgi:hypothetical protein